MSYGLSVSDVLALSHDAESFLISHRLGKLFPIETDHLNPWSIEYTWKIRPCF